MEIPPAHPDFSDVRSQPLPVTRARAVEGCGCSLRREFRISNEEFRIENGGTFNSSFEIRNSKFRWDLQFFIRNSKFEIPVGSPILHSKFEIRNYSHRWRRSP